MPINFRCTACDRTLSIATRKAGTQVNCPKCGIKVLVPATAGVAVESNPAAAGVQALEAMPLFERPDFESLLDPAAKAAVYNKPGSAEVSPLKFDVPKVESPKIELPKVTLPAVPVAVPMPVVVPMPMPVESSDDVDVAEVEGVIVNRTKLTWIAVVIALLLAASFAVGYFIGRATGGKAPATALNSTLIGCG